MYVHTYVYIIYIYNKIYLIYNAVTYAHVHIIKRKRGSCLFRGFLCFLV